MVHKLGALIMQIICMKCGKVHTVEPPAKIVCGCGRTIYAAAPENAVLPDSTPQSRLPIGTWISKTLAAVGVTPKEGCGCEQRKQNLDKLGEMIYDATVKFFRKLRP